MFAFLLINSVQFYPFSIRYFHITSYFVLLGKHPNIHIMPYEQTLCDTGEDRPFYRKKPKEGLREVAYCSGW